ncbi:MAG: class I SAM-dependent methyltransferase [Pseudomonadota bacterium]
MNTFDPIWETKYNSGHTQRYPWDAVVSFIFRNAPRDQPRNQVNILEVGCGTASNLWCAAREGFNVTGIDASISAIEYAQQRFKEENLSADLQVADFTNLPFENNSFDLIIDRCALTCCGFSAAKRAINEIHRVSKTNAIFFFNPYSDFHTSASSGKKLSDGLISDIQDGTLVDTGQLCFYNRSAIELALKNSWNIFDIEHLELEKILSSKKSVHAEWRVLAKKIGDSI